MRGRHLGHCHSLRDRFRSLTAPWLVPFITGETNFRASAQTRAVGTDTAAIQLNNRLDQSQSKTKAAGASGQILTSLHEWLEYLLKQFRRHAKTVVANRQDRAIRWLVPKQLDRDLTVGRTKLYGILQ